MKVGGSDSAPLAGRDAVSVSRNRPNASFRPTPSLVAIFGISFLGAISSVTVRIWPKSRAERSAIAAEKISRFLDAHSFDDARYEDGAERIGKFINRLFQHRTNFTLRHALLRIAAGRRGRKVDDFRLVAIGAVGFPIHRRTPASQS